MEAFFIAILPPLSVVWFILSLISTVVTFATTAAGIMLADFRKRDIAWFVLSLHFTVFFGWLMDYVIA